MKQDVLKLLTWEDAQEIFIEAQRTLHELDSETGDFPEWSGSTEDAFKEVIARLRGKNKCKAPIAEVYHKVLAAAESVTGTKLSDCRSTENSILRALVSYYLRVEEYSFSDIGKMMGRDHSTVIHHVNRMKDMLSLPSVYRREIEMYYRMCSILN